MLGLGRCKSLSYFSIDSNQVSAFPPYDTVWKDNLLNLFVDLAAWLLILAYNGCVGCMKRDWAVG